MVGGGGLNCNCMWYPPCIMTSIDRFYKLIQSQDPTKVPDLNKSVTAALRRPSPTLIGLLDKKYPQYSSFVRQLERELSPQQSTSFAAPTSNPFGGAGATGGECCHIATFLTCIDIALTHPSLTPCLP